VPAPTGWQPQVGDKLPDSMTAQQIPRNVTDHVPEAKNLLFVKLPDRIILQTKESRGANRQEGEKRLAIAVVPAGSPGDSQ
jgi:hypothetical protein